MAAGRDRNPGQPGPVHPGAETEAYIDGIRLLRVGSARSYAVSRLGFCLRAVEQLQKLDWDLWVNEFSAFAPLRVPAALRRRGLLFFQHFLKHPYGLSSC